MNPGGCRCSQALSACANAAVFVSTDEPFAIASMVSCREPSGSGNSVTPLARMHSENSSACTRVAVVLLPSLLPLLVSVSEGALEQPADPGDHDQGGQRTQCRGHCCILGSWVGSAYMAGQPWSTASGRSS